MHMLTYSHRKELFDICPCQKSAHTLDKLALGFLRLKACDAQRRQVSRRGRLDCLDSAALVSVRGNFETCNYLNEENELLV